MNIEIPVQQRYCLRLSPAPDVSADDGSRIYKEPYFVLPTLPYPGLKLNCKYEEYKVIAVSVEPQSTGYFTEEPKELINVDVEVEVIS